MPERLRIAPTLSLESRQPIPLMVNGSPTAMPPEICSVATESAAEPMVVPAAPEPSADAFVIATLPALMVVAPV